MLKRFKRHHFAVIICLALGGAGGATAEAAQPSFAPSVPQENAGWLMEREINRVRTASGLAHLKGSPILRSAAQRYARWLVLRGRFLHAVALHPPGFRGAGELLGRHYDGYGRVRRTVRLWMQSPPHRRELLNPRYREGGAGLVHGLRRGAPVSVWALRLGYR